ncbi:inositol monophosphatase family protein [Sphingomonas desiccabilis]|uniref:Inositol monophosphatase n=1 Tax=Sphingomonas desiccabilis TaxID=429134 RepID=A0A4Q2IMS9_9SPHN|nr:inositol monophosphatase [Sphingomonas desiccabilis]MBB3912427.1 fructose-1,6-bisphosphatase/inositol monophosphatase family enzyme [Sphingomonas desiccabilis]RXZ30549.1 inositol monophosphatase [Sphingomonas desiccabilis]
MSLAGHVAALMRDVADRVVMPRHQALAAHEIAEKSPGEVVTCVDREAEARLREGLDRLGIGARVVGEEACAENPALLDGIGSGAVWLVDPLDGTANFASGSGAFGIMVALVSEGEPVASWMLDPGTGRMCHAERGLGAWIDERPVRTRNSGRLRPVAALATQFMAPAERVRAHRAAERRFALEPIPRCAAESYPRLVNGRNDVALFQRILPWDHAAGVLFLTEAGGHATHWDGSAYRVGSDRAGLLAAADGRLWEVAAEVLRTPLAEVGSLGALAA